MSAKFGLQGSVGLQSEEGFCAFVGLSEANKFSMSNGRFDEQVLVSFSPFFSGSISQSALDSRKTKQECDKLTLMPSRWKIQSPEYLKRPKYGRFQFASNAAPLRAI